MNIIQTTSFKLATISKGDPDAPKLALVLPGRLDTKDYVHMTSLVDFLATRGYLAVSFDPPGTWDSPGNIEIYSTTNYIKAINELIEHFGNRPTVLLGHSRGGTVAIQAGALNPHVTAIVPIAASYGIPTPPSAEAMAAGTQKEHRDLVPGTSRTEEKREFALPMAYFQDGAQYNSAAVLETCDKPKLLIYCDKDEFTPSEKVQELFKQIPEPKMIYSVQSEHDYRLHPAVMDEVNKVIGEFLDKYSALTDDFTQTVTIMANTPPVSNEDLKRRKD